MIPQKTRSRLKVESYLSILQPFTIKDEVSIWRIVLVQEMKQQTSKRASIELSNKIERFLIPGARIIDYAKVVVEAYLKYSRIDLIAKPNSTDYGANYGFKSKCWAYLCKLMMQHAPVLGTQCYN